MSTASRIQAQAQNLPPVMADNQNVVFENEKLRIRRVKYAPHEKLLMRTFPATLEINLTVAHLTVTYADGKTQSIEARPGQILSFAGTERMPENLSDFPYEALAIEMK
jgi:hypothetical protein